ncbi:cohesin complex subunit psm1 [Syncephalis fuscata]|nr:cohesin complex subunit psm1 [Syncephalis fuscata]
MGRLLCLEVENFKSYCGQQIIGPFDSFTSIIGPNGAGKSNLMDAISFVLGVKSAQLRSTQLSELIYRGSGNDPSRRGKGPATSKTTETSKRAAVTAVYVDNDANEVRLTRSITHTGVSEYKKDGRTVTYTEYAKYLEEQNVLVKARNFLVFQGDVESIASQSPKDLTQLIEEISGSHELAAEYERLKVQQTRATENSTDNFNKKREIAAEMKQFREHMQKQQEQVNIIRSLWRLYHIEKQFVKLERELDRLNNALAEQQQEKNGFDTEYAAARRAKAQIQKQMLQEEQRIRRLKKGSEESKPALLKLEEMVRHLQQKIQQLQNTFTKLTHQRESQQRVVKTLNSDLQNVNEAAKTFEATVQLQAQKSGLVLDEQQLQAYREIKDTCELKTAREQEQITTLKRQRMADKEAVSRLEEKFKNTQQSFTKLSDEETLLVDQRNSINEQIVQLSQNYETAKLELITANEEKERIAHKEIEVNEKLNVLLQRLMQASMAKRASDREKRFTNCVRDMKRIYPGVYGRVLDLCKPNQRKYDAAVSVALGKNMEAIIVDKQSTAIECIQYMREQRIGQATFLPLDTLHTPTINERLRSLGSGVRLLIDTIQYDAVLERAMQYVCSSNIVCDTIAIARRICYEDKLPVKAVTLEGTIIHKSGLITGGKAGVASAARRWEEREVEAMKKTRDSLVVQLKALAQDKRQFTTDTQLQTTITGLETRLAYAKEELSAVMRKLAAIQQQVGNARRELEQLKPRITQMQSSMATLDSNIGGKEQEIYVVEDELFESFCQAVGLANIRDYEQGQLLITQQNNEKRLQFTVQQTKLNTQLAFENQQLDELNSRAQQAQKSLENEMRQLEIHQNDINILIRGEQDGEKGLQSIEQEIKQLREQLVAQNEIVGQHRKQVEQWSERVDETAKTAMEKESDLEKLGSDRLLILRRCRLDGVKLPFIRGSIEDVPMENNEAAENFGMEAMDVDDTVMGEISQTSSLALMRSHEWSIELDFGSLDHRAREDANDDYGQRYDTRLSELTAEIELIAPNLRALDRLDNAESRYRAVEQDFEQARRSADEAQTRFKQVKQERHRRFMEAFGHIEAKIDQVYKDLTKSKAFPLGGTAYLSVENTEEPYLEGIRYHAMPPMKRFRDMEQLSGGEKTVAAFALLLAIHSYRPAPFFVMDEVDAALDNANVSRIASYISQQCLTQQAQFIVISLKNSLYECAQSLVGVYRDQTSSSSRVLTLKLTDYQE